MKKNKLTIVKIGGQIFNSKEIWKEMLRSFADIAGAKILVHGGGPEANEISKALGIPSQKIDGRRITDGPTLKVVTMVYAGWLNKQVVSQLQSFDCNALGLSGADLNLIQCRKRKVGNIDFGFVGDIEEVNVKTLEWMLKGEIVPILNAITHDGNGQLLNTNADTIAAYLAAALSEKYEVHLFYCFDKSGVLKDIDKEESLIDTIDKENYPFYQSNGVISEGMIPKIDNAFFALDSLVTSVHIGHYKELKTIQEFKGTKICL